MRQLFPIPLDDVDPVAIYAADERPGQRWLLVNMISSVDGATAIAGRSGALGGPADKAVFRAIRGVADVILVGAGTVRAEDYGPPSVPARLAIVTASLDLDPGARVFSNDYRPLVITHASADPGRRAALEVVADVVIAGEHEVDLRAAIEQLDGVILCEGGPSLNGELIAADLVDEWCLSLAPLLVSGDSSRIARGAEPPRPRGLQLARVLEADGYLFLRLVRAASAASPS